MVQKSWTAILFHAWLAANAFKIIFLGEVTHELHFKVCGWPKCFEYFKFFGGIFGIGVFFKKFLHFIKEYKLWAAMSPSSSSSSSFFSFTVTYFLILVSLIPSSLTLSKQSEQSQNFSFCEQVKNGRVVLKEDTMQAKHVSGYNFSPNPSASLAGTIASPVMCWDYSK